MAPYSPFNFPTFIPTLLLRTLPQIQLWHAVVVWRSAASFHAGGPNKAGLAN